MGPAAANRIAIVAWVALVAGCGRLGYEPLGGDAGPDAPSDAPRDAPAGPPCRSADGFSAPSVLSALSSAAAESSLRLAADGTGVFAREIGNEALRIFTTKLGSSGFATPVQVAGAVNEGQAEGPTLSADGSLLLFASERGGAGYDVWGSVRVGGGFSPPSAIPQLNTAQPEFSPYLLASGKALYFTRVEPGAGVKLMRAAASDGQIGSPTVSSTIPVVTSPVVSEDELELFYAVNGDIYRSTRNAVTEPFAAGLRSAALSTGANEEPTWLSPDGCMLYLASDRAGAGAMDLWVSSRR